MADPTILLLFNAEDIVDTVRQPMLVLSAELRVRRVNRSFCQTFQVTPEELLDRLVYDLGNRQWNIPALKRAFVQPIFTAPIVLQSLQAAWGVYTLGYNSPSFRDRGGCWCERDVIG